MATIAESLISRYYPAAEHPNATLRRAVARHLNSSFTVLDLGCGHDGPELRRLTGSVRLPVGLDPVARSGQTICGDARQIPLTDASVDLAYSRSVFEHLQDPLTVLREARRVLRPGGQFFILTPNLWDYATVFARLIPNRLHPWIVRKTEGRPEEDTFPAFYRANSERTMRRLAGQSGFCVESIQYLNQYPSYLTFSRPLFLAGMAYERITSRYHCLRFLRGWLLIHLKISTVAPTPIRAESPGHSPR